MSAGSSGDSVQVGDWIVSPALDTISRRNEVQKLEPRTMRLLMCLVDSAGGVVSVDRLLTDVWAGVVVGPASVYQAVSQLRKILGDVDPEPTYIATVSRKGYRLVAAIRPVEPILPVASDQPSAAASASGASPGLPIAAVPKRQFRPTAIGAVALIASIAIAWVWLQKYPFIETSAASIVVLPFVDLTAEKTGQPFCDGLTEELSNWLSQIPTLRVVARTSAFAFRGTNEDVRKIGEALDTNHILEGSMRRSGDHMRVTVQLIDARKGYHLWSAEYDKPMDDTIKMQEDISRSVAQNLQIRLTPDTALRLAARRSDNPQAYQLYLRARYYQQQRTRDANNRAIDLYEQALVADPKFALAYVGLSYSRLNQQWLDNRPISEVAAEVEPLIATAVGLGRLSDVYTVRAALRSDQYRLKEARDDLRLAISINPNDSRAFAELGRLALRDGQPRDALSNFNRAVVLDPLDFRLQIQLCTAFEDMAQYNEARAACERAHELQPDNSGPLDGLTWLAWSRGLIADALRWNGESLKLAPDDFELYWTRSELYSSLGLAKRAREALVQGRTATDDKETVDAALGSVAYLEGGPAALRTHLEAVHLDDSQHSVILLEVAYLRLLVGEPQAVEALIARALKAPDREPELDDTPWSARVGESSRLNLAAAELASGKNSAALPRLEALVAMLDRMIDSGVERYSTYELRAEAQALRGHADEAMQDLTRASRLGWRRVWWAEHEPYLASLRSRSDFQTLMTRVSRSNDRLLEEMKIQD